MAKSKIGKLNKITGVKEVGILCEKVKAEVELTDPRNEEEIEEALKTSVVRKGKLKVDKN